MAPNFRENSWVDAGMRQAMEYFRAGRFAECEAIYRQILASQHDLPEVRVNLAFVLSRQGKIEEAIATLRLALNSAPDHAEALHMLGNLLMRECADGASPVPGSSFSGNNRVEEGLACFSRYAKLAYGPGDGVPLDEKQSLPHRIKHDNEQREYLAGLHGKQVGLKFNLGDGGRISSRAVNDADPAVAERWQSSKPKITVIDDFLTDEALEKLRNYCHASTIWRVTKPEGYLIAMPDHGFDCPLIAQIDEELRQTYSAIFQEHALRFLWAFKYDSSLSGVGTHSDAPAQITVNFWITPDEANLDPECGGLIVWDATLPSDWTTSQRIDTPACRAYLAGIDAKSVTIPYRANRAVVFASDLIHETDHLNFDAGYLNRRVNVTLLYHRT